MRGYLIIASALCIVMQRGTQGQALNSQSGLILQVDEGERLVRRPPSGTTAANPPTPTIIKVDRKNGGSPDLVMGYESCHRAVRSSPTGTLWLMKSSSSTVARAERRSATAKRRYARARRYTSLETFASLSRTRGKEPMAIAFFFSKPGFEEYMRDTSVPEGQPAPPMSSEELQAIRQKHAAHTIYEPR